MIYSKLQQSPRRRVVCKIKMDQKWIHVLMILVFYQEMKSGAGVDITPNEKESVDIKCVPPGSGTLIIWFRVLDTSGVEFIGSFSNNGMQKSPLSTSFTSNIQKNIMTLKSFNTIQDSGTYSCAILKSNELKFGEVTRLIGAKAEVTTKAPPTTPTKQTQPRTTTACQWNTKNNRGGNSLFKLCNPIILGPLAGSCGLLLLLLIIISVYCNRIRTRRCPHHYKRKPRTEAPGKQMMANRHV